MLDKKLRLKARLRKIRIDWQKVSKLRFLLYGSLGLAVLVLLFLFGMAVITYYGAFGDLPDYAALKSIKNNIASEVYSEDGVLLRKYYVQNRVNADFEEISPNIVNALIATEDARFFEHGGIDFRAWGRVLVKTVLMDDESAGGGSTLSQQLAKNIYPRQAHPPFTILVAKLKETFIARRLEKIYTKEQLLKLYLNTVPFGDNIYGIKVASKRFFNKSPQDLKLEEAAVLVGMLKGNTLYHPVRNPENALKRRNTVLNQMVKYGYAQQNLVDSLKQIDIDINAYRHYDQTLGMYFTEHLRLKVEQILKDIEKPGGGKYDLYKDGIRIYTTLDSRMQAYAEKAVAMHMEKLQNQYYKEWRRGTPWGKSKALEKAVKKSKRYQDLVAAGYTQESIEKIFKDTVTMEVFSWKNGGAEERRMSPLDSVKYYLVMLNTGFLAMEPNHGLVRAWVGGIDYRYFQYDHVKSKRQVGSTFKPIVYTQALRSGMLPCEYTQNSLVRYVTNDGEWQPRNADGAYEGVYSMEGALSHSVNVVSVELLQRAGIADVKNLAQDMGIEGRIPEVPSIALGTIDASLYEMVKVYGTFANRGLRPDMHYLDRIETNDGKVIISFNRPNPRQFKQVIPMNQADMMVKMMQSVVDSGTAKRIRYRYGLYNQIAGKTGTTQNHTDGWFIGFTPKIVAGAWVGADDPNIHFKSLSAGQGANTALPIWALFMQQVYKDPAFRSWRKSQFPDLSEESRAIMACPPFLEEMPILASYDGEDWEEFDRMKRYLPYVSNEYLLRALQNKRRRNHESFLDYADRLERYIQRIHRQEERNREGRKNFWKELLFNKNKQKNN